MQDKAGVDQNASAAELMAWARRAQEELEVHGELNQVNLLLCDFTETVFATKSGVRADAALPAA
jgi:hypothetical protein